MIPAGNRRVPGSFFRPPPSVARRTGCPVRWALRIPHECQQMKPRWASGVRYGVELVRWIVQRTWIEICAVTALAAVLRLTTLGFRVTTSTRPGRCMSSTGRSRMLHSVARVESAPPLYCMLAWGWSRIFGTGGAGLRLLSAVAGVAIVPVVYALGRALRSRRVGLVAGAIVATSPYLVFYSQEARSYALFVLISTTSVLVCVRAIETPTPRMFALWAAVSIAAIATHYFAIFPGWVRSLSSPPLAPRVDFSRGRAQRSWWHRSRCSCSRGTKAGAGHADWIGASSLLQRMRVTAETFTLGATFKGSLPHSVLAVCALLAAVSAFAIAASGFLLARRASSGERRAALIAGVIAAVSLTLSCYPLR